MTYYRPIAMTDAARTTGALPLAGGWCWFDRVEVLTRGGNRGLIPAADLPDAAQARLTAARVPVAGCDPALPALMGIVNVTPDSFSDGGRFNALQAAVAHAEGMIEDGANLIDIGGESTRPGAATVDPAEEIARAVPVISALRAARVSTPISIDTRKAEVAAAALDAGADMVNDVSALSFDPALAGLVADRAAPVCLMHAQGAPATMQVDPRYDDVLLDVYDWLAERIDRAEVSGIPRTRIVVDPGIGFGKTAAHNLTLIRGLSLFHGLGCTILLGASRKRFIGTYGGGEAEHMADRRMPGTLAVMLAGLAQGVQIHRVHDMAAARQALRLWQAVTFGEKA